MKQQSQKTVALLATLVLSAAGAHASIINIGDQLNISDAPGNYTGPIVAGLYQTGDVNGGTGGAPSLGCYAGPFNLTVVNTSQGNNTFNLLTFCTDVGVEWNDSTTAYTAKTFAASDGVNPPWSAVPQAIQNAAWIYKTYFLNQEASIVANAGTTADENIAAGIQLAIWKVLYDTTSSGGLDSGGNIFTAGNFQASGFGGGITVAEGYISALLSARSDGTFATYTETWLGPNNGNSQGLIYSPVPEPSTLIAGAMLLLPFGASTLRFVRKNRTA
jgi:hypothetical protein